MFCGRVGWLSPNVVDNIDIANSYWKYIGNMTKGNTINLCQYHYVTLEAIIQLYSTETFLGRAALE